MAKRRRSNNYTNEETMNLINLVKEHKDVVENKKTDAVTWHDKKSAWEKITNAYNSWTTNPRSADQLKQKFDTLKRDARKYAARRRQQALQTGGGPPPPDTKDNFILEAVLQLIILSAVGLHSDFDCDVIEAGEPIDVMETAQVILPDDIPHLPVTVIQEHVSPIVVETVANGKDIEVCDGGIVTFPWNSYTPQMLRKPLHPALNVHMTTPSTSKENVQDVSVTTAPPITQEVNSVSASERRVLPSSSSTPKNWATRRRPVKKNVVRRPSASGRMLQPWAEARKNLAVTQRNLLIKEFKANEERKKNIYLLQKSNLLLEKKSLELDIEIKKATLEKINNK